MCIRDRDSFGRTEPLLTADREKYAKLTDIRRQMHALQMDEAEKARRMDTLRYQIQELQRAKLRPGEEEELTSRRNLLRNGEKFMSAVSEADFCLSGDEMCIRDRGCPQLDIRLDPLLTPQQNAARYFKQYAKAKTAERILTEQLEKGRQELSYLESVVQELQQAELEQDFNDIRTELTEGGYLSLIHI